MVGVPEASPRPEVSSRSSSATSTTPACGGILTVALPTRKKIYECDTSGGATLITRSVFRRQARTNHDDGVRRPRAVTSIAWLTSSTELPFRTVPGPKFRRRPATAFPAKQRFRARALADFVLVPPLSKST